MASWSLRPASAAEPIEIDDKLEINRHLIGQEPTVVTPWIDLSGKDERQIWYFEITVDETGRVTGAKLSEGPSTHLAEAIAAVKAARFRPFVRHGRAVPVHMDFYATSRARDYLGPVDRRFPASPDLATVTIALSRSSCYGACPGYRVELRGDGQVIYSGDGNGLVNGVHRWHVDPASISPLLELFRKSDYFSLKGYYEYPISDVPTYITRLSIGKQHKFVLDHGSGFGETVAYVDMPDGKDPGMPAVVSDIENKIDEVAKVGAYVYGDETTMQRLREEHWDFRSKDAGEGLRTLLYRCKIDLAREFILAGAPVNVAGEGFGGGRPIAVATNCADAGIVQLMVKSGALQSDADARDFLWSSVEKGYPELVAIALTHYRQVNIKDSDGTPLLAAAAKSYANEDEPLRATKFDSAKVIDMLIAAGANPNARDKQGATPLFDASTVSEVNALIRGGADPKARNQAGETPLFDPFFDDVKAALIAAGTDVNARDQAGATALFRQEHAESIKVLLDAGADIDATDATGHTAIEQMKSEKAVAALLAAGAKLPTDPARLRAMIGKAAQHKWTDVLAKLEATAARK